MYVQKSKRRSHHKGFGSYQIGLTVAIKIKIQIDVVADANVLQHDVYGSGTVTLGQDACEAMISDEVDHADFFLVSWSSSSHPVFSAFLWKEHCI